MRKLSIFGLANGVLLAAVAFVTLFPFLYMASVSLSGSNYVLKGMVSWFPRGFNVDMYKFVLDDPRIMRAYWNTIVYAVVGTAVALVVTGFGAYALSKREMFFHRGFTIMIVITMFFSGGMIPTFLVVRELGIMNSIWAMVLPSAVSTWNLLIMRTFFANIPKELEESSFIDGAGYWTTLWKIFVPISLPAMATIGLFTIVGHWNSWFDGLILMNTPDQYPLASYLQRIIKGIDLTKITGQDALVMSQVSDRTAKAAQIFVGTFPILLVYPFLQRYFVQGIVLGSVKE